MVASFLPGLVNAQPKEINVQGTDFVIYTDSGLTFQSGPGTQIMEIEVLSGTWVGENCRVGVTVRGGELYWKPNATCDCVIQVTNYDETNMRITIQDGFSLSVLYPGESWNGTFGNDGPALFHWSWALDLPHEENWSLLMGLIGIALFLIGLFLMAYLIRTYPIFSFTREILFDKISFAISISMIIIGLGFIVMWLMS